MKPYNTLILAIAFSAASVSFAGKLAFEFEEPSEFTDFSVSGLTEERTLPIFEAELDQERERLGEKYLGEDETLTIRFTDIDMAGDIQPWRNRVNADIRYVEAIYPPRLVFTYELTDADGDVVRSGEESIKDLAFQMNAVASIRSRNSSFYYEITLLEDWLRKFRKEALSPSGSE